MGLAAMEWPHTQMSDAFLRVLNMEQLESPLANPGGAAHPPRLLACKGPSISVISSFSGAVLTAVALLEGTIEGY